MVKNLSYDFVAWPTLRRYWSAPSTITFLASPMGPGTLGKQPPGIFHQAENTMRASSLPSITKGHAGLSMELNSPGSAA